MSKYNADNERIKRKYYVFLKEAKRQDETTIDAVAKAIRRFEDYSNQRDFKKFNFNQAVAFKKYLANLRNVQTGRNLSKATVNSTLGHLKRFFQWLSDKSGYKSRISYSDADYFNLSEKDTRIAKASHPRPVPTLEQIKHVLGCMPVDSDIALRNRAIITFTILTGARDNAIASLRLKHIDLAGRSVYQDAREVRTKFSKSFTTYFFPVGEDIQEILEQWVKHLKEVLLWGNEDPLFPATAVGIGQNRQFESQGLKKSHWSNTSPIRSIFKEAFTQAGLPYFNPHSFRNTLVGLGEKICNTPEDFKAWSQNLGHEEVLTTFYSYGEVPVQRQSEIIRSLGADEDDESEEIKLLLRKLAKKHKI